MPICDLVPLYSRNSSYQKEFANMTSSYTNGCRAEAGVMLLPYSTSSTKFLSNNINRLPHKWLASNGYTRNMEPVVGRRAEQDRRSIETTILCKVVYRSCKIPKTIRERRRWSFSSRLPKCHPLNKTFPFINLWLMPVVEHAPLTSLHYTFPL